MIFHQWEGRLIYGDWPFYYDTPLNIIGIFDNRKMRQCGLVKLLDNMQ